MSIYGHHSLRVRKQPELLRWLICTDEGVELLAMPWYTVYNTQYIKVREGNKERWDADRREALDLGMTIMPLTEEDRLALFKAYPDLRGKREYVPRDIWSHTPVDRPSPPVSSSREPPTANREAPRSKAGDLSPLVNEEPALPRKLLI